MAMAMAMTMTLPLAVAPAKAGVHPMKDMDSGFAGRTIVELTRPSVLTQPRRLVLQTPKGLQSLRSRSEMSVLQNAQRRCEGEIRQTAVAAVLIGQVAAEGRRVAAA